MTAEFGRCRKCEGDAILRMNMVPLCMVHFQAALRTATELRDMLERERDRKVEEREVTREEE